MKYATLLGAMLLVALLISACGPAPAVTGVPTQLEPLATAAVGTATALGIGSTPAVTKATTSSAATASSPAATTSAGTASSPAVVSTQPAGTTATAGIPVTGETIVKATLSDTYGPMLVDGDGNALYMFKSDTQNGDTSACTDEECTADWTPLTTTGAPVAGAGVIQKLLGTITREDGTMQVTYNGWPLYISSSGSIGEQGADNAWFLVTPSGSALTD